MRLKRVCPPAFDIAIQKKPYCKLRGGHRLSRGVPFLMKDAARTHCLRKNHRPLAQLVTIATLLSWTVAFGGGGTRDRSYGALVIGRTQLFEVRAKVLEQVAPLFDASMPVMRNRGRVAEH